MDAITVSLARFTPTGEPIDNTSKTLSAAQVSDIVSHAAQAVQSFDHSQSSFDAVLAELKSALTAAGVIDDSSLESEIL